MTADDPLVREYMTRDVSTVAPEDTVGAVTARIEASAEHNGFPVVSDGYVEGFVTASDLLGADPCQPIRTVMADDILVAAPKMTVTDAARVILRSGIQKLPVVDDEGRLEGIIANADVIRSHIERATPGKVDRLRSTLASIHDVGTETHRARVPLDALVPTQEAVYADELEGRRYELRRGLAEPLVVIDSSGREWVTGEDAAAGEDAESHARVQDRDDAPNPSVEEDGPNPSERAPTDRRYVLADGHHRATAARQLDVTEMEAYVITLTKPVELGMVDEIDVAEASVDDVEVVDYARHPLVATTTRLQDDDASETTTDETVSGETTADETASGETRTNEDRSGASNDEDRNGASNDDPTV